MRTRIRVIALLAAAAASGASPSGAQSPQSYPYCAFDTSSGATSCYYSSRAQCGSRCFENPSYQGPQGANASARGAAKRRAPRQ
jgi:hypothetical protein